MNAAGGEFMGENFTLLLLSLKFAELSNFLLTNLQIKVLSRAKLFLEFS